MGNAKISLIEKVATALRIIPNLAGDEKPARMGPGVQTGPFPLNSFPRRVRTRSMDVSIQVSMQ